jgi:hypothetical protein
MELLEIAAFYSLREKDRLAQTAEQSYFDLVAATEKEAAKEYEGPKVLGRPMGTPLGQAR